MMRLNLMMAVIIAICLIVGGLLFLILLQTRNIPSNSNSNSLYEYAIVITTPTNNEHYWIVVPLCVFPNETVSPIVSNLTTVYGTATWHMIDTSFGKGLNISGYGDVAIRGNMVGKNVPHNSQTKYSRFPGGHIGLSMWVNVTNPGEDLIIGKVYLIGNVTSLRIAITLDVGDIHQEVYFVLSNPIDWEIAEVKVKIATP